MPPKLNDIMNNTGNHNEDYEKSILKIPWVKKASLEDQNRVKKLFYDNNGKRLDHKHFNRRRSEFLLWLKSWRSVDETISMFGDSESIDKRISLLKPEYSQKLNKLSTTSRVSSLDILENEDSNISSLLVDALVFIENNKWNVFEWNITLSDECLAYLKESHPELDTNHVTFNWLCKNVFDDEPVIKNEVELVLTERFLSPFCSYDSKIDDSIIDKEILRNPAKLKEFIDYYNYKNSGTWKVITIPRKPFNKLSDSEKSTLRKAIKEELYASGGFDVDLTEDEKNKIDEEIEKEIEKARKVRGKWTIDSYYRNHRAWLTEKISNYDGATWRQIAIDLRLWNDLWDKYGKNIEDLDINDSRVFKFARWNFCKANKNLWLSRFPEEFIKKIYQETNNFTNFWWDWGNLKIFMESFPSNERDKLNGYFSNFSDYLKDAQKKLSLFNSKMGEKRDIVMNNIAIGSVIDGIRDIFKNLWEKNSVDRNSNNLQLDKEAPVKLDNNSEWLIINWTFKWNPVKIRYDLTTWEVYMNACITEVKPWNTIIFWKDDPNFYIWKISDFHSILSDFEDDSDISQDQWKLDKQDRELKKQKINESFEKWIDEIKDKIWDQLETNFTKKEASTKFLRTIGIINDNQNEIVNFDEWSDVYKVMQIINNSEKDDINAFSEYMVTVSKYFWKIWGSNEPDYSTEFKDLKSIKNLENYPDLDYFIQKINTSNNYSWQTWKIDQNYRNWFASLIFERFTDRWKLNKLKVEEFGEELKKNCSDALMEQALEEAWI